MQKTKSFFFEHRYFFGVFFMSLLYQYVITGACKIWQVHVLAKGYYALDFSIGFSDRLLPGAIYNLFFDDISDKNLTIFFTAVMIVFFMALSALTEKAILTVEKPYRKTYCILFFLFLTGPCTFSLFVHYLGMIEFYWIIIAVLFFLFLAHKPLQIFIMPLCLLVLLVSSVGIVTYVPLFCILLLYKLSAEKTKCGKRVLLCSFLLCVCGSIPFAIYLLAQSKNNINCSFEELHAYLVSKGVEAPYYTEYFLFHRTDYAEDLKVILNDKATTEYIAVFGESSNAIKTIIYQLLIQIRVVFLLSMHREWSNLVFCAILTAPVWGMILCYFIRKIRDRNSDRLMRFSLLCMILLFFSVTIMGIVLSVEHTKWFSFAFFMLFVCFLYICYYEKEAKDYVKRCISSAIRGSVPVYCALYAFTTFALFD